MTDLSKKEKEEFDQFCNNAIKESDKQLANMSPAERVAYVKASDRFAKKVAEEEGVITKN